MINEKIFEVRIVSVDSMPEQARADIVTQVAKKTKEFRDKYRGFAKVTYVTASPKKIGSVEPIEGTIVQYFKSKEKDGVIIPTF